MPTMTEMKLKLVIDLEKDRQQQKKKQHQVAPLPAEVGTNIKVSDAIAYSLELLSAVL